MKNLKAIRACITGVQATAADIMGATEAEAETAFLYSAKLMGGLSGGTERPGHRRAGVVSATEATIFFMSSTCAAVAADWKELG